MYAGSAEPGLGARSGVSVAFLGRTSIGAWTLTRISDDFIPIPGTKRLNYLEENIKAIDVQLTSDEEKEIRKIVDSVGGSKGDRYPPYMMAVLFGDSPELPS